MRKSVYNICTILVLVNIDVIMALDFFLPKRTVLACNHDINPVLMEPQTQQQCTSLNWSNCMHCSLHTQWEGPPPHVHSLAAAAHCSRRGRRRPEQNINTSAALSFALCCGHNIARASNVDYICVLTAIAWHRPNEVRFCALYHDAYMSLIKC